jgi:AcrR family transcriptional regulator
MEDVPSKSGIRSSYHHGNLTEALTEAAIALARGGGPDAVVLREAARKVGVSPTAAYRHFAGHSDLKEAVKHACQDLLGGSMRAALAAEPELPDPAAEACRRFRAIGLGYFTFARAQPGLYLTAFCRIDRDDPHTALEELDHAEPYALLTGALDDLLAAGLLHPARRPLAEAVVWSAAHGLAMLMIDGPLAQFGPEILDAAIAATMDTILAGLTQPPSEDPPT